MLLVARNASRSPEVLAKHMAQLQKIIFCETYTDKGHEFVTKTRFKAFMKRVEGYESDDASSSFERRLEEASSDNEESEEGLPQVKVRGNKKVGVKTCTLVKHHVDSGGRRGDSSRNRSGHRDTNRSRRDTSEAVDGGRGDRRRLALEKRSRSRRRRGGAAAASTPSRPPGQSPAKSPPAVKSEPASNGTKNDRSRSERRRGDGPRRRMTAKRSSQNGSTGAGSTASFKRGVSKLNLLAADADAEIQEPNEGLDFLKSRKIYKKEMEALVVKFEQKQWAGAVLKKLWDSLGDGSSDAQRRLGKQGNYQELMQRLKAKTDRLKQLLTDLLENVDADTVSEWENKRQQALDELKVAISKAETFIDQVKEVKNQASEAGKVVRAAEAYQVKKIADQLLDEPGSFGSIFSKALAPLLRKPMDPNIIVAELAQMDYSKPMVLHTNSTAGGQVCQGLETYIEKF